MDYCIRAPTVQLVAEIGQIFHSSSGMHYWCGYTPTDMVVIMVQWMNWVGFLGEKGRIRWPRCTSASVSFDSFVELHQVNCADSLFINPKTSPRHPQDIPRHPIDILQIPHRHTPICPPPPDTLQTLPQISCRHSADTPHTSPRHPPEISQGTPQTPPRLGGYDLLWHSGKLCNTPVTKLR